MKHSLGIFLGWMAFALATPGANGQTINRQLDVALTSGTLTVVETVAPASSVAVLTATMTSNADGIVSGRLLAAQFGLFWRGTTDPDDTDAPSDNYDLTLLDDAGIDLLNGRGDDRDSTDSQQLAPLVLDSATTVSQPVAIGDRLTFQGLNMGESKTTVLRLYIERRR